MKEVGRIMRKRGNPHIAPYISTKNQNGMERNNFLLSERA